MKPWWADKGTGEPLWWRIAWPLAWLWNEAVAVKPGPRCRSCRGNVVRRLFLRPSRCWMCMRKALLLARIDGIMVRVPTW